MICCFIQACDRRFDVYAGRDSSFRIMASVETQDQMDDFE